MQKTIKLKAGQRLLSRRVLYANVDEHVARQFIKQMAGIEPGRMEYNSIDSIQFNIDTPQNFMEARKNLIAHFGKMGTTGIKWGSYAGTWYMDPERKKCIFLNDTRPHGAMKGSRYTITLADKDFAETHLQYLKRTREINPIHQKDQK